MYVPFIEQKKKTGEKLCTCVQFHTQRKNFKKILANVLEKRERSESDVSKNQKTAWHNVAFF